MQQVVAETAHVETKLDGVVTQDLGPVAHQVDVGFRADPRHTRRVADHRIGEGAVDAHQAAGEVADVDSGNSQVRRRRGAVIAILRDVVIVRHAETELGQKGGTEEVVPVETRAVSLLDAGAHEGPTRSRSAGQAEYRRLVNYRTLEAEAAAEAVVVAQVVVDLAVREVGVLAERQ